MQIKQSKDKKNLLYILFVEPFKIWFRIMMKNAPAVTHTGAKNFKEIIIYWVITLCLPFVMLTAIVYIVDAIKRLMGVI